jgi:hypothetical protein
VDGLHATVWKPLALLLLIPKGEDVVRYDTVYIGSELDSGLSEFLNYNGFVGEGSSSAIFSGHVGKQDPCCSCFFPGFGIGAMLLAPAS